MTDYTCVDCNENASINGVRCLTCEIDFSYSEMLDSELTLDWNN